MVIAVQPRHPRSDRMRPDRAAVETSLAVTEHDLGIVGRRSAVYDQFPVDVEKTARRGPVPQAFYLLVHDFRIDHEERESLRVLGEADLVICHARRKWRISPEDIIEGVARLHTLRAGERARECGRGIYIAVETRVELRSDERLRQPECAREGGERVGRGADTVRARLVRACFQAFPSSFEGDGIGLEMAPVTEAVVA